MARASFPLNTSFHMFFPIPAPVPVDIAALQAAEVPDPELVVQQLERAVEAKVRTRDAAATR